jgi:tetratricopeptide (TPR) repeat protein
VRKSARRYYDLAIADLEKALLGRPRDARISETLCLTLVQFGQVFDATGKKQYARAKQLLDEWLATEPDNTSALAILADWQTRNSTLEAVLTTCDKGQKLDRARPEFLLFSGWAYKLHGQPQQAIECFTKAIELQPEPYKHIYPMGRVDLRASRARAYVSLGEKDEARKELQLATSTGVKEEWTFFDWDELIRCYCLLGDSQEALRWSDERALITPECPRVYETRRQIYLRLGRVDEALADFDKAIELDPKNAFHWLVRGNVYSQRGEWPKALADFDKAIELDPEKAVHWLVRGDVYSQRGEWPKAIADYERAHQVEELGVQDINGMAWLLATCPDRSVWKPDRAIEYAMKAVAIAPNEGGFWNTLGVAQYRAGQCKEAVTTLSKSMELRSGGDAFDWFFLAMAHGQLGKQEEARQWYQKAVAWTQTNKPDDEQLRRFQAEAAALLGVTLPTAEPAPEPAGKVEETQELPKSTPAPEAAKEEEPPK